MPTLPKNPNAVESLIDEHWRNQSELPRPHLGGSTLGKECERALWYGFRWTTAASFPGRIRRLFRRGHHEEVWFVDDLKAIGLDILERDPVTGKQFLYSDIGGHVGGSADGLGMNVPEAPKTPHILEFKTHSEKSFLDMKKKGVEKSKPLHFSQVQIYMHWQGFTRALYVAVNKNTDELYSERVRYDPIVAKALVEKARRIITATTPPPKLYADPSFFECKFCDHHANCHLGEAAEVSCRTCISATPEIDGDKRWSCNHRGVDIPLHGQRQACPDHRFIPDLLGFADVQGNEGREIKYKVIATDREFINGTKGENSYTSLELSAIDPALIGDDGIEALREHFDGVVTTVASDVAANDDGPIMADEIPF